MSARPAAVISKSLGDFNRTIFDLEVKVAGVALNASKVKPGDLFVALAGEKTHGANFVNEAIKNGAVAVLSDKKLSISIPSFIHPNPREIIGELSAWIYSNPFNKLTAVGVTGTNGKTTTTSILKQLWQLNGLSTGLIGTLGIEINQNFISGIRTTPEADELQALVALMVEKRVSNLAMEVSSHSIVQHRIKGSKFRVVAFSNLTQDHLDYHKSMENYFKAKADLFNSKFAESAVINIDDSYGLILSNQIELPHQSVSRTNKSADWFYKKIDFQKSEYNIEINSKNGNKINGNFKLLGEYNLDNLLLAVALASATGLDDSKISLAIPKIKSIPGRLEQISAGQEFTAIVDYAHTPDAVSRVLKTARSFTSGKVIALLGCGGDRDKSKRPLMGKALFAGSDVAVFTSDNPRSESPDEIISAMINGIDLTGRGFIVNDRKAAIDFVVSQAVAGDCVLVLGKGHESGQEIMGVTSTFDDRIELANSITKAAAR